MEYCRGGGRANLAFVEVKSSNRKCTGMDEVDNDHYFRTGKRLPNDSEWWLTMTVLMLIHP